MTEDEMVGQHHRLNGHEFEQTLGDSEVSQKEKNKYSILMYLYGIQKNGVDESIFGEKMEMQRQRWDSWTQQGKERVR